MRMLIRMNLDPARMELLAGFFETYLKLSRGEEEQYNRELGKLGFLTDALVGSKPLVKMVKLNGGWLLHF